VTADDFGLDEAINLGIERAAGVGILTAASLMVGAPAAARAVQIARNAPTLKTGLHLVLADGWSVLPHREIPDLVGPDRRFRDDMLRDGVRYFLSHRLRIQLAAEIRAQFAAYAATGLELDHVNTHKHFHLHPTLLDLILDIGEDFGLPAMRMPHEPYWFSLRQGLSHAVAAGLLTPWVTILKRRLRQRQVAYNDQIFGISCTGRLDEATMLGILAKLPAGTTEIYMHPAIATQHPLTSSMREYRHEEELEMLHSPRVLAAVRATGAECGGFSGPRG
jgi:hopanoid biosynthesis associated protein HpnK